MKRSEMVAFIYDEVKEALDMRKYSNETDEAYWRRRSTQLLDMVLGFGMLPPSKCDTGKCSEIGCGNEWEEEENV